MKTYHYWRKTYNINKVNMFYIQETNYHKGIDISNKHYVLYQGTIVASYDEICNTIDALILAKTREIKINKLGI
jgi:hypothetical protein